MLLLAIWAGIPVSCAMVTATEAISEDENFANPPPIRGFALNATNPGNCW
eukprot:CAMPEP_0203917980 /NCGR_PEP_ID=MMETSP0359-20131031/58546_1 /ASSEMBLY_ACC=CAM_ASM_000338 /TAXON_ID=268821 /ORGANISM="Scrippsiella Hangoei, Strain SHTV-5" /LENGTH=49 /DNA_ID=CAMNT_0050844987 /DNA_START=290 /DNA_END=439 /DNA_ORIENTATION=+